MKQLSHTLRALSVLMMVSCTVAATAHATFPQSDTQTVSAPGKASLTSSELPPGAKSATFDVQPQGGDELDEVTATLVGTFPKLGKIKNRVVLRVLSCYLMAPLVGYRASIEEGSDVSQEDAANLFMALCLELAFRSSQRSAAARAFAGPGFIEPVRSPAARICKNLSQSLTFRSRWTGRAFKATPVKTAKTRGKSALAVTCKPSGRGFRVTLKPRSSKRKLRSLVGPTVGIGFANSGSSSVRVKTTISVK